MRTTMHARQASTVLSSCAALLVRRRLSQAMALVGATDLSQRLRPVARLDPGALAGQRVAQMLGQWGDSTTPKSAAARSSSILAKIGPVEEIVRFLERSELGEGDRRAGTIDDPAEQRLVGPQILARSAHDLDHPARDQRIGDLEIGQLQIAQRRQHGRDAQRLAKRSRHSARLSPALSPSSAGTRLGSILSSASFACGK